MGAMTISTHSGVYIAFIKSLTVNTVQGFFKIRFVASFTSLIALKRILPVACRFDLSMRIRQFAVAICALQLLPRIIGAMNKMATEMSLDCDTCEYAAVCEDVSELRSMRRTFKQRELTAHA